MVAMGATDLSMVSCSVVSRQRMTRDNRLSLSSVHGSPRLVRPYFISQARFGAGGGGRGSDGVLG